ncbi:BsuPI-related putative proteinase inhibitor [Halapricum salinum]|nr:BsuPI-related putative proteinase inhibitor [Halapricum salinum]
MTLDCTLSVEQADGELSITLTATNTGSEPVELTFSDGQTIEAVAEHGSQEIWRYSEGRMFTQALRTERLAPDERLVESVTWSQPPAGGYDVRAWLCANGVDCGATAAVSP